MSEYKRLTLHNLTSAYDYAKSNLSQEGIAKIYDRLAELEDKIESGQWVELPCKVGDTVWYLNTTPSMYLERDTVYEGHIARYHIVRYPLPLGICVCADIQIHNKYGTSEIPNVKDLGKSWFLTKAQAEARLKELKGEKL